MNQKTCGAPLRYTARPVTLTPYELHFTHHAFARSTWGLVVFWGLPGKTGARGEKQKGRKRLVVRCGLDFVLC